jgi:hypothetical protein
MLGGAAIQFSLGLIQVMLILHPTPYPQHPLAVL